MSKEKPFQITPTKHQVLKATMIEVAASGDKELMTKYLSEISADPYIAKIVTEDRDLFDNGYIKIIRALHKKD